MTLGDFLGPHVNPMSKADAKAARAAMGVEDEATIVPIDMSRAPLFLVAMMNDEGDLEIHARSTMPLREAAKIILHVADQWEEQGFANGEPNPSGTEKSE